MHLIDHRSAITPLLITTVKSSGLAVEIALILIVASIKHGHASQYNKVHNHEQQSISQNVIHERDGEPHVTGVVVLPAQLRIEMNEVGFVRPNDVADLYDPCALS